MDTNSLMRFKFTNLLSLKSFICLGFIVAVIPNILGMFYAAKAMHETAALGRAMNYQVYEQTKIIRLVLQKTSDIERKARLFVLLSDPALRHPYERQSYETARGTFKEAINELLNRHVDDKIALLANELSAKENLIYQQIVGSMDDVAHSVPIDKAFQDLRQSSNDLSQRFEQHVEDEFNELRRKSEALEKELFAKGGLLLLISLVLIIGLLIALSRSIRSLDAAIRRLGFGDLALPISISGPSDFHYWGERLEWLRTYIMALEVSIQKFIYNFSLELKAQLATLHENPMQTTAAKLAQETPDSGPDSAMMLAKFTEKLKILSDELSRFSQISSESPKNVKETVEMKKLVELTIAEFQIQLRDKSIILKTAIEPVLISGYHEQLQAIIKQLLVNAIKYSPINGEIRIMLRHSASQMELEVEDEGPGIVPDEREKVFEPFFRGTAGQATGITSGFGLGLALVQAYVANHQGSVTIIDSRQGQKGAVVRLVIPVTKNV